MMKEKRNYDLQERVIEYAVRLPDALECLPNSRVGHHVAAQLIRAGTSPVGQPPRTITIVCFVEPGPSNHRDTMTGSQPQ